MGAEAVTGDGKENSAAGQMGSPVLRVAAGAGTFLLIAGLLYFAWVDLRCAGTLLAYPFGDYGEGIVWQQALLIPGRECMARSITCPSSFSTTPRCITWRREW
jgi:hypothetical protein